MKYSAEYVPLYMEEIRKGQFKNWSKTDEENGIFENGKAVYEEGYADIELNIYSESDPEGNGYINKVCTSYFVCLKDDYDWHEFGYPEDIFEGFEVDVDFNKDDWEESLKMDMQKKLGIFLKKTGFFSNKPNTVSI